MFIDSKCVFALCKYSTSLVTNVNRKKSGSMKYFFQCSLSLYEYLKLFPPGCTSLATLLQAVSHNHVTLKLYGLMINIIKMLFK